MGMMNFVAFSSEGRFCVIHSSLANWSRFEMGKAGNPKQSPAHEMTELPHCRGGHACLIL